MNEIRINFKENKHTWDAFVMTSPQRSIFVYSKFLDSLLSRYDLVTCYERDRIVAGVVIIYTESGRAINTTFPFTQYQGMLYAGMASKSMHSQITYNLKITDYFIKQLTNKYRNFYLSHSWRLGDLRAFQWHNYDEIEKAKFKVELRYTAIVDIKNFESFEAYLSTVRTARKQEYKKASQSLIFQFSDNVKPLDELHEKTFKRQKIDWSDRSSMLVQSICSHAVAGEYGKMGVTYLDGIPISAVLFLRDDRTAYYLFGANDPKYRNTGAGTFTLLNMIKNAFDVGLDEIDLVGANSPQRGDFKISFNADLRAYHECKFNE